MKKKSQKKRDIRFWGPHVQSARKHPRSISAYCREHGLSRFAMSYWEKRCPQSLDGPADAASSPRFSSAFIPVEVLPAVDTLRPAQSGRRNLPNPKWVAEFIVALSDLNGDLQ